MTWTNIPDANLDAGSPLRDVDLLALRDNIVFAKDTHGIAVFTSSGTFIPVANITKYEVFVCAGGGGGNTYYVKTGGFGGVSHGFSSNITSNQSIVVGAAGVNSSTLSPGTAGGSSSCMGLSVIGGGGASSSNGSNGSGYAGSYNGNASLYMPTGNNGAGGSTSSVPRPGIVVIKW